MATLANGLETLDYGSTAWVLDINNYFSVMYHGSELSALFDNKALLAHHHDYEYEVDTTTIDQGWLQPVLSKVTTDIKFTNDTEGVVVYDNSAAESRRIYVSDGVIYSEVV